MQPFHSVPLSAYELQDSEGDEEYILAFYNQFFQKFFVIKPVTYEYSSSMVINFCFIAGCLLQEMSKLSKPFNTKSKTAAINFPRSCEEHGLLRSNCIDRENIGILSYMSCRIAEHCNSG